MQIFARLWNSLLRTLNPRKKQHRRHARALAALRWSVLEALEERTLFSALYWDTSAAAGLQAGSSTWNLTATNWNTAADGSGSRVGWIDGSDAVFVTSGSPTVTISSGVTAHSITFTGTGYDITGGTLTLTGSGAVTANLNDKISAAIAGSAGLNVSGAATLTLSGANTFTGGVTVSSGTLKVSGLGTLGDTSNGLTIAGGTLDLNGTTQSVDALNGTSGTILNNATGTTGTLVAGASGGGGTFNGVIINHGAGTGVVALTKAGAGTLILSSNNTYSGTTTISDGVLQIGNGATLGTIGSGAIVNNAALSVNRNNTDTIANVISGTGALIQTGTGTTTLTGANTYSGTTTILAGVLQIGSGGTSGSVGSGDVLDNGGLAIKRSDAYTLANDISGSGSVTLGSTGTILLSGANTASGGTIINAGRVQLAAPGIFSATAALTVNTGAILDMSGTSQTVDGFSGTGGTILNDATGTSVRLTVGAADGGGTFSGILADNDAGTGTLAFTKAGAGTVTLKGANTYSGLTTIDAGTLKIGNGNTGSSLGTGSVVDNGTLAFNRSDTYTVDNLISGTGGIVQLASTAIILTAANTYTGGTVLSLGTVKASGAGTWGASSGGVTLTTGTTLDLNGTNQTVGSLVGDGGKIVNNATGTSATLTLGANDGDGSYSGQITDHSVGTGILTIAKTGTGTLIVLGDNNYSGGTTISGGVLQVGADSAFGAASGDIFFTGNATVRASANVTLNAQRTITINAGVTATFDPQAFILKIAGNITGGGAITRTDTGTLTLTGVNSLTGGPTGVLDTAAASWSGMELLGWALDVRSPSTATEVDIYDGSTLIATTEASFDRPDLASVYTYTNHGFSYALDAASLGWAVNSVHSISVYTSGVGNVPQLIGQQTVKAGASDPFGNLDSATVNGVTGWAYDNEGAGSPVSVTMYVNGVATSTTGSADNQRDDLVMFGSSDRAHGYSITATSSNALSQIAPGTTATVAIGAQTIGLGNSDFLTSLSQGWASPTLTSANMLSVTNHAPTGTVDAATPELIAGSATDSDTGPNPYAPDGSGQIYVDLYIDGEETHIARTLTQGANHTFSFDIASLDLSGDSHTWQVTFEDSTAYSNGSPTEVAGATGTISESSPYVVSISRASTNPSNAMTVDYSVVFNKDVLGVDSSDFQIASGSISGASITGVSGSGTDYVVSVGTGTGAIAGTLGLNLVDDDSISSAADGLKLGGDGTGNGNFTGDSYDIDRLVPIVNLFAPTADEVFATETPTISGTAGTASGDSTTITLNIYEGSIASGTPAQTFITTESGGSYSAVVPTALYDYGQYTVQAVQADSAGNNGLSTPVTFIVDTYPPTVMSITPATASSTTNSSSIIYDVVFNEPVTGVSTGSFSLTTSGLTGASISSESGTGAAYAVTVDTGSGDGTFALNLDNSVAIYDLAGNAIGSSGGSYFYSSATTTIDRTAPTVSSIARTSGSSTSSDNSVSFTVTFDEAVNGVDLADFNPVMGSGISGAAVSSVTGSGTTYSVTVDTGIGGSGGVDDTLGLALVSSPSISDLAGNVLTDTTPGSTQSYTIDKSTTPFVSIIRSDDGLTNATTVHYSVTFTSSVSISSGDFTVTTAGISGASVTGISGSGASYTVTVDTGSGDGLLRLDLTTSLTVGGSSTGTALGQNYVIEKTPPAVLIDDPEAGDQTTDSTPTITGIAEPGETVTVKVYAGTDTSGTLETTLTSTADDSGVFSASVSSALTQGSYTVTAAETDGASNTGTSEPVTFQIALAAPSAPASLQANAASSSEIDLSWSAPSSSDCVSGYLVNISTDNGQTLTTLATLTDGSATSFQATGLHSLSPYVFQVYALNAAGTSTATVTPVVWTLDGMAAPSELKVAGLGMGGYQLDWTNNAPADTTSIEVEAKWAGSDQFVQVATLDSTATSYTWGSWSTDDVTFRVRAVGTGEEAYSSPITGAGSTDFMDKGDVRNLRLSYVPAASGDPGYYKATWNYLGTGHSEFMLWYKKSTSLPGYSSWTQFIEGAAEWYSNPDGTYSVNLGPIALTWPGDLQIAVTGNSDSPTNIVEAQMVTLLPAPTLLTAVPGTINTFDRYYSLTWIPSLASSDVTGGYTFYSLSSGNFQSPVHFLGGTGNSPTASSDDATVEGTDESGWDAYIMVMANDGTGNSSLSNFIDAAIPGMPSMPTVCATGNTSTEVVWSDKSWNEDGFEVQRSLTGSTTVDSDWRTVSTLNTDVTSYIDSSSATNNIVPGETYYYRVRAIRTDSSLDSAWAYSLSLTMPATSCITCAGNPFTSADGQSTGVQQSQPAGTTPSGSLVATLSDATGNTATFDGNDNSVSSAQSLRATKLHNGTVIISAGGGFNIYFAVSGGTYSGIGGNPYFLNAVTESGTSYLVLTDGGGTSFYFYAFTGTGHDGRYAKAIYPNGLDSTVDSYNSNGDPTQITEELAGSETNVYSYSYNMDGTPSGVSLTPNGTGDPIQTTDYTYSGGNLQRLTVTTYAGTTADTEISYMRYYQSDDPLGQAGSLKYLVTGSSYESLLAANGWTDSTVTSSNLDSLTDAQIAPYADNAYQYDSAGRVTSIVDQGNGCSACTGGFGTTTFAYASAPSFDSSDAYNTWTMRQTQLVTGYDTLNPDNPENSEIITYSNAYGQVMLQVNLDVATGQKTMDYYRYDSNGQEILHANPSAVTGYDESLADLVGLQTSGDYTYLSDSSGVIEYTDYYGSTTAGVGTVGGVEGYLEDTSISKGDGGPVSTGGAVTKHYQSFTDYVAQDAGGPTVYFVADQTNFANDLTVQPIAATSTELTDADARTTQYGYTWFSGTNEVASTTTTLPTVTSAENGPNAADTSLIVNDSLGRTIWTRDADGYLTYTAYDDLTGAVTEQITDASATQSGAPVSAPTRGSGLPTALNLVTTYAVDNQGRTVEMTDPKEISTFTVYDDANHATYSFVGTKSSLDGSGDGTVTITGPIQMTRTQVDYTYDTTSHGTYDESMTLSTSSTWAVTGYQIVPPAFLGSGNTNLLDLTGSGSTMDPQFVIQSLARTLYNTAGQMIESDAYSGITNAGYLTTSLHSPYSSGTGVGYNTTTYGYDARGQQALTISSDGTITINTYDYLGRTLGTYVGTDDVPGSNLNGYGGTDWEDFIFGVNANPTTIPAGTNMTLISLNQYDGGGVGDSNLTQTTEYPDGSTAPRVTQYLYDWQNREVATKTGVQTTESNNTSFINVTTLDNLGETTAQFTFAADGAPLSDFASGVTTTTTGGHSVATVDASSLRAYSTASYDEQGRTFQSSTFSVDPTTGYISADAIVSNTWFDHRGDVIESQTSGGPTSKMVYDGAGRTTIAYTTDGGAVNNSGTPLTIWSDAGSVTNDIVLEQAEYLYDADGDVLMTTDRQRFHDDSDSSTGTLGTNTSGILARVSYTLSYYDALNRTIASVDVGTNGGVTDDSAGGLDLTTDANSDGIPDILQGSIPTRSDDVLVTSYTYNAAGEIDLVTDPRGIDSKTYYDALGQTLFTVAAWDGSYDPTDSGALPPGSDANQTTGYTYDGDGHTLTMTAVLPSGQDSQTTQYVYGVTTADGSTINSNDILALVKYPDPSTGAASSSSANQNSFTYDALGEVLTKTDQNGTTHTYTYDVDGRQILDAVTILGSGVDGTILSVGTTYNDQGQVDTVTSYTTATADSGHIANQVEDVYNGLGQLTAEYQEHAGAVDTGSTLSVGYSYDTLANGGRITSMTYPSGTVLHYDYGTSGSLNDVISRLNSLIQGSTTVEGYAYLGLSTVVLRSHPEDGIDLTYLKQTGEADGDAGDQYIGLDRFGRVHDQRWIDAGGVDQDRFFYTYDADGNVTEKGVELDSHLSETYTYDDLNRLTSTTRDPDGTPTTYQSFDLDAVGNMNSVTDANGTVDRTTNDQNELSSVGSNTLGFDDNGNTTTDDQGHTLIYDAWNRLVEVKDGSTVLESYAYDGLGRRITEAPGTTSASELYYSSQDQVIEERQGGYAMAQYVWSPVYVNALVLRDRDADNSGDGVMEECVYVIQDANFNVTALITYVPGSVTWGVVERLVYDGYGAFTVHAANWDATTDYLAVDHTFQGMQYDFIVKMNESMTRFYSPTMMRWISQDPSGLSGMNNYWSLEGNPILWTDPTGLYPSDPLGKGGSPVHEGLSNTAAEEAGYDKKKDCPFFDGLDAGVVGVDFPDGAVKSLFYLAEIKFNYFGGITDPLALAKNLGTVATYDTQFGKNSYQHGMAPPGQTDPNVVQGLIVDWVTSQYQKALAAPKQYDQGLEIGKALHTLQDSYSLPHTNREPLTKHTTSGGDVTVPGAIKMFQDYNAQDPSKHEAGEAIFDPKNKDKKDMQTAAGMAQLQSSILLKMLRDKKSVDDVKKWLTEGELAPFRLAKGATSGGSLGDYAKK